MRTKVAFLVAKDNRETHRQLEDCSQENLTLRADKRRLLRDLEQQKKDLR